MPRASTVTPIAVASLALAAMAAIGCGQPRGGAADAGAAQQAPNDVGPPRPPPPLRAAHLATPPLPDLPSLDAHEASTPLPFGLKLDAHPCGTVWTGASLAPLACLGSSLLFGRGEDGAEALVPYAQLGVRPERLPAVVDHRLERTEGPVRNQGQVPACTAFAMASALDHAIARWTGAATHVSVMQIWSRYHTPTERKSIASNLGQPLAAEADWPFDAREAASWTPCDVAASRPCDRAVDAARVRRADGRPIARFTHVEYMHGVDPSALQEKLAAGQDVVLTMTVPATFEPKGRAGARYVPHYTKVPSNDSGHAVLLAGYARLAHGTYFLVQNSWGAGWGDGGYAWMHEATIRTWAREALVLDAEPQAANAPRGSLARRVRGETTCAAGRVPDSIRGTCAPPCPDGSPRHDGVCAVASQCPAGFVNLTGACVLAAPSSTGRDAGTGIAWACGPGGCSYVVPRALDPACTGNECRASCPAPSYRLARAAGAITCVE